jgi:hypothetical protein
MNEILICWRCSQIFEVCYCLEGSVRYVSLHHNTVLHSGDKKGVAAFSTRKLVTKRKQGMTKVTGNCNFSTCYRPRLCGSGKKDENMGKCEGDMWQCSWLRHYATSWKVVGLIPNEVMNF